MSVESERTISPKTPVLTSSSSAKRSSGSGRVGVRRVSAARMGADRLLFEGWWFPVTDSLVYFATDVTSWVDRLMDNSDGQGRRASELLEARPVTGTLEQLLEQLLPLESRRSGRLLAVPVAGDGPYRTALLGNRWTGADLDSYRGFFARIMTLAEAQGPWVRGGPGRPDPEAVTERPPPAPLMDLPPGMTREIIPDR